MKDHFIFKISVILTNRLNVIGNESSKHSHLYDRC